MDGKITIVNYTPTYAKAFKSLNEEWISRYFTMEESDYRSLNDPDGYIINKGGFILMALYNDEPVGTCALIKMHHNKYNYELAKMAVSPSVQGKGIGWLLAKAVMDKAKQAGAKWLYLESNTRLTPAITLYEKMGFVRVQGITSPYERCNIQMELELI